MGGGTGVAGGDGDNDNVVTMTGLSSESRKSEQASRGVVTSWQKSSSCSGIRWLIVEAFYRRNIVFLLSPSKFS